MYNLCCHKANKVLDANGYSGKNSIKRENSEGLDHSDNGDDFAVHYEGENKIKVN